jgi:hypothetical protein
LVLQVAAAPSCYLVGSLQPVRCLLRVAIVSTRQISGSICCSCGSETFLCRSGVFALDVLLPSLLSQMCFVYLPLFPDSFSSLLRFAGHIALGFTSAASEELGLNLFQSLSEFG